MLWCNLLPKYNLYVGHLFPKTPPVQDKVYLGSSIPRLIGDQVFWFLLKPCVPDDKLVSKCKLQYSLTLSVPLSNGLPAMHLLEPCRLGSYVPIPVTNFKNHFININNVFFIMRVSSISFGVRARLSIVWSTIFAVVNVNIQRKTSSKTHIPKFSIQIIVRAL